MIIICFIFWCCMFSIIFIFIEQLMGLRHPRAGVLVVSAGEKTMEDMEYIYIVRHAAMILSMLQPIS